MNQTAVVGVVGLGLVGTAVARRLLGAGRRVLGYDIAGEASRKARDFGVQTVDRLSDLPGKTGLFILSLPAADAVDAVLWGSDGIGERCGPGSIILDTTTTRAEDTVRHNQRIAKRGVRFADVTLVGSSAEIAEGRAVALVGDTAEAANAYADPIKTFATHLFFLGGPGKGNQAKLLVNLVLGLNRLVLAEALAFAEKTDIKPGQLLEILKASAAYSRVMDSKGEKMLTGNFEPVARLAQHAKDVGLILELAKQVGGNTPLSELHARMLQEAIKHGWGELDNSAIIRAFQLNA
ncbi:MAG: NAD(P)-dependent oxidoreductase [Candidatus Hydrogenedentes bacterium]|nr:NAD(P)-dependent oxidoreductase [Candidatus Hydrogenedentota bacterium]